MTKLVSTQELREAAARYQGYAASWAENAQAQETAAYREHAQVMARQYEADAVLIAAAAEQVDAAQQQIAAIEKLKNDALAQYDGALAGIEGMPDVSMGNYDEQQWHFGFRRGFKHRSDLCDTISTLEQRIAALRAERDAALDKLRAHSVE